MSIWDELCNQEDYIGTNIVSVGLTLSDFYNLPKNNSKDLVVLIQSRSRPDLLKRVLDSLYNECSDKKNFDIFCLVDSDQKDMYGDLIEEYSEKFYTNIFWCHPEHTDRPWTTLKLLQHHIIKKNDYYFNWTISDDIVGFHGDWDERIIAHKEEFDDNLFTLAHSLGRELNGRKKFVYENCYNIYDIPREDLNEHNHLRRINLDLNDPANPARSLSECLWHGCELFPVFTKKWIDIIDPIFQTGNYAAQHDAISAAIVMILKMENNINRLVISQPLMRGLDKNVIMPHQGVDGGSASSYDLTETGEKLDREASHKNWTIKEDFKIAREFANKIYNEIYRLADASQSNRLIKNRKKK